jgi:glucose/arabinose dehydrogenase
MSLRQHFSRGTIGLLASLCAACHVTAPPNADGGSTCGAAGQACCTGSACSGGLHCLMNMCEGNKTGTTCKSSQDCQSGLCLPLGNGTSVCTSACSNASDCIAGWSCASAAGLPGSVCTCSPSPQVCDGKDDDCNGVVDDEPAADQACVDQFGAGSSCVNGVCNTPACTSSATCPMGQTCDPTTHECVEPDAGTPDAGMTDGGAQPDAGPNACDVGDGGPIDAGWNQYDGGIANPCALPGSWVHDSAGVHVVGNDPAVDAGMTATYPNSWLHIPEGFCAHHYAVVPNARQLRFAPNGDLFVTSPTLGTTGGGPGGLNEIVVVPDDNRDGYGDAVLTFRSGPATLNATQGILFANGYIYYQFPDSPSATCQNGVTPQSAKIVREPFQYGQRRSNGCQQDVIEILTYCSDLHWPKTLDVSDDGTIYVGNGGDQGEQCIDPMPTHGGIWAVDGTPDGQNVVLGMRNPYAIRCHHDGNNHCYSTELTLDYSGAEGGREKLIEIQPQQTTPTFIPGNIGFPCCATANQAYPSVCVTCSSASSTQMCASTAGECAPQCNNVAAEHDQFLVGDTPFGLEFVDDEFPTPWDRQAFVSLHGAAGSWTGARIVGIALDPNTGIPQPGSDTSGSDTGAMADFATGWDDNTYTHGRPADLATSPDGRLFVGSDTSGEIFWIAPITP